MEKKTKAINNENNTTFVYTQHAGGNTLKHLPSYIDNKFENNSFSNFVCLI